MLEHTFIHIRGIGRKTESNLWGKGIRTWHDFMKREKAVFSPARDLEIRDEIETSIKRRDDIRFFNDRLAPGERWRLFSSFKERAVYLDIETSGGYQGVEEITLIGLYDGCETQTFVNGVNLEKFEIVISDYDLVITFNGASFDLPIIRRCFPGISLPSAHIDLRFLMKRLGHRGGLKKIEKDLGILRDPQIDGMDGYDAVLLWKAYQWGDRTALERLIQYNTSDIVNLRPLMEIACLEMKHRLLP